MPAFYLIAEIRPRMDVADEVADRLRIMRDGTREEPGNISMDLVWDEAEPDVWYMLEKFASREAWELHMTMPHNVEGNAFLEGKLREPTILRFFAEK